MNKTTAELLNELKQTRFMDTYLTNNQSELYSMDLKQYLDSVLEEKNLTKAEVITRSNLHQIYAYQIFSGKKSPSRDKILALCLAMELSVEESQHLLRVANVAELYPRNKRDAILIFAINKHLSVIDCNALLYETGECTLE